MKIAIGNDHRGLAVKQQLITLVTQLGHEVLDLGAGDLTSVDYPDFAAKVCRAVMAGEAERGILICGTGIGMAIAANKFHGIRAITVGDVQTAEMCRRHNNVNVMCLSESLLGQPPLPVIVRVWLDTQFEGGRHQCRLNKIADLERENE